MATKIQQAQPQSFSIVAIEQPELREIMKDNLSDIKVQFERIRIPAGGGLSFEITDENGDLKPVSEIVGVILDRHPVNAYWPDKFTGAKNPPACVAMDGRHGVGDPGGDCMRCPYNQWGSDKNGRGKACKNLHRVYILPPNEVLPLVVALPPTSLANLNSYMLRLTSKAKKPYWAVITKIKLEKAVNADGITFSRAVFTKIGDVPPDKIPALKQFIAEMKPLLRAVEVVAEDYNVDEADNADSKTEPF